MKAAVRWLSVLLMLALMLYPALVYWGLQRMGPQALAAILLLAAAARLLLARLGRQALGHARWLLLAAAIATGFTMATGSLLGLKAYPVLVNLVLLVVFALSLRYPPSVIERFARLQEPQLPPEAVAYTRRVTQVWCGFFVLNGSLALASLAASEAVWALYNGLIAYLLMGLLMAGEYLVRRRVQARHRQAAH